MCAFVPPSRFNGLASRPMRFNARGILAGAFVAALSLPVAGFADDDRNSDIDQDKSKIHQEERDLRNDQRHLDEEMREGDRSEAQELRHDMTEWTGSTTAFVAAVALIALWLVSGPIF